MKKKVILPEGEVPEGVYEFVRLVEWARKEREKMEKM